MDDQGSEWLTYQEAGDRLGALAGDLAAERQRADKAIAAFAAALTDLRQLTHVRGA
jgi:hypothetical protein